MRETDAFFLRYRFDPEEEYKMDHRRRGIALIFNQKTFSWKLKLPDRLGTEFDRDKLIRRFNELGFEVKCFNNLKAEEIQDEIDEASTCSHADADCFVCVFLSHGEGNSIYAYDAKIEIQMLTEKFEGSKCPTLIGKPKIFIIQAARGDKYYDSVTPLDALGHETSRMDIPVIPPHRVYHDMGRQESNVMPAGADFLMCYSVAEGYCSFREIAYGSWYIQDLCEMLGKYGSSLEFTELLTLVNRKVSQRRVDFCLDRNAIGKKQIPCFSSMLTKKLRFYPKASN
ncbi:caspase-6-like [Ochotona curzoniae]|uniref:caspase-6-like n=1 Tax=Ochotona curzoniae TaxID=130825 RepID=UPI001B351192|nr:caspase-6-like [Ochotona curzoniae]